MSSPKLVALSAAVLAVGGAAFQSTLAAGPDNSVAKARLASDASKKASVKKAAKAEKVVDAGAGQGVAKPMGAVSSFKKIEPVARAGVVKPDAKAAAPVKSEDNKAAGKPVIAKPAPKKSL